MPVLLVLTAQEELEGCQGLLVTQDRRETQELQAAQAISEKVVLEG